MQPPEMENSTWSLEDHYRNTYGPVRDQLYVVIPISIIYASIFVTGTVGNISTCVVIARNKSMHTATNYYLFSLAVSDLLLLLCGMPVEIYQVWYKYPYVFGEVFCVLRGLAAETSTNASVLTITAFTAERYVAICHPFLSQTMSKLSRAIKHILLIWLIALACAIPQALQFGIVQFASRPEDVMCHFKTVIVQHSFELSTVLFFIVPMTLIMVLYILIGLKLKQSTLLKRNCRQQHRRSDSTRVKVGGSKIDRHCRHNRSTRRVLKMLVAVVVAFFICWAPFHMQRLIAIYAKTEHNSTESHNWIERLFVILTYVSGVLYYFSTTINPILYNIMSNKFREAFMETLARSCRMSRLALPRERRSYSSLSRSQQRPPGAYPSRTTGLTGGTAMAQESTDCSGNSFREEQQETTMRQDSTLDTPPLGFFKCGGSRRQSSHPGILTIEIGPTDTNLPHTQPSSDPSQHKDSPALSTHFTEALRQQTHELSSPGYDRCIKLQNSPCGPPGNGAPSKKKWWRLLDWLPGLKIMRASRTLGRHATQETTQPSKNPEDYYMQMRTFQFKDESCRPV